MSDQPAAPEHTEDPEATALLDTYEASLREADRLHSIHVNGATKRYKTAMEDLNEARNPSTITDLIRGTGTSRASQHLYERLDKITETEIPAIIDLTLEVIGTSTPGTTEDDLPLLNRNLRIVLDRKRDIIPQILDDPRFQPAIDAGDNELFQLTRAHYLDRTPHQQTQLWMLTLNHVTKVNTTDPGYTGLVLFNGITAGIDPQLVADAYQIITDKHKAAFLKRVQEGFTEAYLFGRNHTKYRTILPALEAVLAAAGVQIPDLIRRELQERELRSAEHTYEGLMMGGPFAFYGRRGFGGRGQNHDDEHQNHR